MEKMTAVLVNCSNPPDPRKESQLVRLREQLTALGMTVRENKGLYRDTAPLRKWEELRDLFSDSSVTHIMDVSGGDLANELLSVMTPKDWEIVASSKSLFFGYSDLTCLQNAMLTTAGKGSWLYSVRNLIGSHAELQQNRWKEFLQGSAEPLTRLSLRFLRGEKMEGTLVGGNIRCLLKVAGTPFFPDMHGKLLLLEACSGDLYRLRAYAAQLGQMGVWQEITGVLLGTFTQADREYGEKAVEELFLSRIPSFLPVARTMDVGHGDDAKAVLIGGMYRLEEASALLREEI